MTIPTEDLTHDDLELIDFARAIIDANTDSEYGVHTMGAAVRGVDGKMYGGVNLFHFTGGPYAELVALGHARASGARELSTIVAVGKWVGVRSVRVDGTARCCSTTTPKSE